MGNLLTTIWKWITDFAHWFVYTATLRLKLILVGVPTVLIGGWFFIGWLSNHESQKALTKAKTNANVAKNALVQAAANVVNAQIDVVAKQQAFNDSVNTVLVIGNASDATKANTNAALQKLADVKAAPANVDVTAQQVINQLDELDGEK